MKSQGVIFDLADTTDRRFDHVIEWMLVGLLAFMPLVFGAVHPWSELVVIIMAGLMSLVLLVKLLARPDVKFVRTWAYVPILLMLALVLFQLLALPAELVKLVSGSSITLRQELLTVPGASQQIARAPLSFYPEATLGQLRLLLAICAIFVVALNVIRRLSQVKRLLGAIAIIGVAMALLALAQNVTDAQAIYWIFPIESNQATSGPFQHHSHFAQFMNLSIGATLGLMLIHMDQIPRRRLHTGSSLAVRALTRPVTRPVWMLACAVVAMAVCIPLSLSRGGMVAMLTAAVFTAIVVATRRGMGGRTWVFIGIVLASLGVLLLFSFDDVLRRASTLRDREPFTARLEIVRGSLDLWRSFPVFGTGLGTFGMLFPMFDPAPLVKTAEHAENEYAQLLVEAGTAGVLMMLAFLAVAIIAYVRCVRGAPSPMASGAMGLGFGIVAVLVHSAADFGQHIPANAVLTAVAFALLINLSQATRLRDAMPDPVPQRAPRWRRALAGVIVFAVIAVTTFDAAQVARADFARQRALRVERELAADGWRGSDAQFARLIFAAEQAAQIRPRDVLYRYELNRYRWRALERGFHPGQRQPTLSEVDRRHARRVIDELLVCPLISPTFAPPYLLAGQLIRALPDDRFDDQAGATMIRMAHRIEPANPQTLIVIAVLESEARQWNSATENLRRAMQLSADHREAALDAAVDEMNRPDLALELAGDDRVLLERLVRQLEHRGGAGEIAAAARRRADQLLLTEAAQPDAPAATLVEAARLAMRMNEPAKAIELFRRATTIEYAQLEWRLELARILAAEGQTDPAIAELRQIIRLSPSHTLAKKLLDELSSTTTAPATLPAPTPSTTAPAPQPGFKFD